MRKKRRRNRYYRQKQPYAAKFFILTFLHELDNFNDCKQNFFFKTIFFTWHFSANVKLIFFFLKFVSNDSKMSNSAIMKKNIVGGSTAVSSQFLNKHHKSNCHTNIRAVTLFFVSFCVGLKSGTFCNLQSTNRRIFFWTRTITKIQM